MVLFEDYKISTDNILFIIDKMVHLNNGKVKINDVTYLGPVEHDGVLKHKIITTAGQEYLSN